MVKNDPIRELLDCLQRNDLPSVRWALQWGSDGQDPLDVAWQQSEDCVAMLKLLFMADWDPEIIQRIHRDVECATEKTASLLEWQLRAKQSVDAECEEIIRSLRQDYLDAIRRHVPVPPRITALLHGLRAGQA